MLKPVDLLCNRIFHSSAAGRWNEVMPPPWETASALKFGGNACDFGGVFWRLRGEILVRGSI